MRRIDQVFEHIGQGLLIGYFIFTFASFVAYRESLRIHRIVVSGAITTSTEAIISLAQTSLTRKLLWRIPMDNAFLYPKKGITLAILTSDARIKSAGMEVNANKDLLIQITEYTPKNLWCGIVGAVASSATVISPCYLADEEGYVFASAPNYSGYPFTVYRTQIAGSDEVGSPIGLFVLPKEEFTKVAALASALEHAGMILRQIDQRDAHDYTLALNEPWTLTWSSTGDPIKSVQNLKLVLANIALTSASSTPESIDLRFGNKVFYK